MRINNYDITNVIYEASKAWEEGFESYENIIKILLDSLLDLHSNKEELQNKVQDQICQISSKQFEIDQYKAALCKLEEKELIEQRLKLRISFLETKYRKLLEKYKEELNVKVPNKNVSSQTIEDFNELMNILIIPQHLTPIINNDIDHINVNLNLFSSSEGDEFEDYDDENHVVSLLLDDILVHEIKQEIIVPEFFQPENSLLADLGTFFAKNFNNM